MDREPPQIPEADSSHATLEQLMGFWKASWTSEATGPTVFLGITQSFISEEQQRADTPERVAYAALVDGAAGEIVRRARDGEHAQVLSHLGGLLGREIHVSDRDKQELLLSIVERSIDLMRSKSSERMAPQSFEAAFPLHQPMAVGEALQRMAEFYAASPENVLQVFQELEDSKRVLYSSERARTQSLVSSSKDEVQTMNSTGRHRSIQPQDDASHGLARSQST